MIESDRKKCSTKVKNEKVRPKVIENRLIFKIVILILRFLKGKRARDKEQKIKSCDKNDGAHQKEPRDHQKCHNKKRDLNIKKCLDVK